MVFPSDKDRDIRLIDSRLYGSLKNNSSNISNSNPDQSLYQDYNDQGQLKMSSADYSALTPSLQKALKIDPTEALLDPKRDQDSARARKMIAENYNTLTGRISSDEDQKNSINQKINFISPAATATAGILATAATAGVEHLFFSLLVELPQEVQPIVITKICERKGTMPFKKHRINIVSKLLCNLGMH
jgi:hypothetical protein